ncbi:hypothetical protein PVAND_007512 [Polypedilum vanderplanki]|uniref:non-specific serine/threonine protein kinase n=1 Tax=Polypedilum vanderplanki TaxID=319348 RepID=A0A9J6C766_POLVA|nr:hypothetical protein PVAND_007512 [Polypedilum vanderplanki]
MNTNTNKHVKTVQAKKKRGKKSNQKIKDLIIAKATESEANNTKNKHQQSHQPPAQKKQQQQHQTKARVPSNSCSSNESILNQNYSGGEDPVDEDEEIGGIGYTSEEEEQESREDYRRGGYHPVKIGDLFLQRYHVIRKIGWGHFSTVWLCFDLDDKRYVALKIVKSAANFTETAKDEIKILKAVRDTDPDDPKRNKTVQLLNDFKISGVNGTHVCMVFEVLGHNLLKLIIKSQYRGIPFENVKTIIRQVLEGLDYLHTKCQIIHTDIKPENVLICVDHEYISKIANEATEMISNGVKLPTSLISTAPEEFQQQAVPTGKLSKTKKKKLKKKAKLQNELIRLRMEHEKESKNCTNETTTNIIATDSEQVNKTETSSVTASVSNNDESPTDDVVSNNVLNGSVKSAASSDNENENDNEDKSLNQNSSIRSNDDSNDENEDTENNIRDVTVESPSKSVISENKDKEIKLSPQQPTDNGISENSHLKSSNSQQQKLQDPAFEVCDFDVKIADLGNACWVDKHFTEDIQTRQYRSLEVIIGAGYDTSADIWSTACMAFELATGDYLFEPHAGDNYDRDDDHLAHIIELLGPIPRDIALSGRLSHALFTKRGELRNITGLKPWDLISVLTEKYEWDDSQAREFESFLKPMLEYDPAKRATAAQCLEHPWLKSSKR